MVIARKIAFNVLVSSVSKVLSTALALVAIGFITRYLGKEGFGNYATVLAFLSFFGAIFDLGLNAISTREISREGAQEEKIMGNVVALRLLSSLLVLAFAPLVVLFFNYPAEVNKGIIIIAASFIFSSGYQVLNGVFQKSLAMDKVAVSELIGKLVQVAIVILSVKLQLGFGWIIASLLFNMIVSFFLVYWWSKKYIRIRLQFDWSYWKEFLKESAPMGVAVIVTFFYFKMDTILLSVIRTSSDVGTYSAAYKVIENITFFPAMVIGLILPIMSHTIFGDRKRFVEISDKTFKFFVLAAIPIIVTLFFLSGDVIGLIGGAGFSESSGVLKILAFALGCIFFGNFSNAILIAGNLQKKLMQILSIAAAFNVISNLILIPRYSYLAAAYVSVATELLVVLLTFSSISKKGLYRPHLHNGWRIAAAGALMVAFYVFFQGKNFLILGISGILVYGGALWLLRAVKTSEVTSLISKKGITEYEPVP